MVSPVNNLQDEHLRFSPSALAPPSSYHQVAREFYRKSFDEVLGSIINFNKNPEICTDNGICFIEMSLVSRQRKILSSASSLHLIGDGLWRYCQKTLSEEFGNWSQNIVSCHLMIVTIGNLWLHVKMSKYRDNQPKFVDSMIQKLFPALPNFQHNKLGHL